MSDGRSPLLRYRDHMAVAHGMVDDLKKQREDLNARRKAARAELDAIDWELREVNDAIRELGGGT
jgi:hypothetical protein